MISADTHTLSTGAIRCFLFLLVAFLGFYNTAAAETPESQFKIQPSGIRSGRILFTHLHNGQSDLHILDFESGTTIPLVTSPKKDEYGTWSPDGRKAVFYSDMSGDREIYTIDAFGKNLKRITSNRGIDEDPDWSPDGRQIVFHSERAGIGSNLFLMNADGSRLKQITNNRSKNTVPKWSPNGDEILYSSNSSWPGWDLFLHTKSNNSSSLLTQGVQSYCRASWHPDGSQFAFSFGDNKEIDIWIQNKGGSPSQITELPGREYDAEWSNDGKKLFFVAEGKERDGKYQLFVLEVANKQISLLLSAPGSIRYPSWTPLPMPPKDPQVDNTNKETAK